MTLTAVHVLAPYASTLTYAGRCDPVSHSAKQHGAVGMTLRISNGLSDNLAASLTGTLSVR